MQSTLIVGTGYVGLVTAVCLAKLGNKVIAVDIDESKINQLKSGDIPFFEPELAELLVSAQSKGLLSFTTNLKEACIESTIGFVAVGTPSKEDGSADLRMVERVVNELSSLSQKEFIIVVKSTVPPGTCRAIQEQVILNGRNDISIISNPEFLREGRAVHDFLNPDKLLLGGENPLAIKKVEALYAGIPEVSELTIKTDTTSSELSKYAANAMLATRISFMNEIARIAASCGANMKSIQDAMGHDPRIGPYFLNSGIGYGGSCFPKDVKALDFFARTQDVATHILKAVEKINEEQPTIAKKLLENSVGNLKGKKIAIWGIAFKPDTDDVREAPSIKLISQILDAGGQVDCYDPIVKAQRIKTLFPSNEIEVSESALESLNGSDALVLVTEWSEFLHIDMNDIALNLSGNVVIDCRNVLSKTEATKSGLSFLTLSG